MDIKTAPFHGPFGDHELTVTVCSYAVNKRLAVNLFHMIWKSCGSLTRRASKSICATLSRKNEPR